MWVQPSLSWLSRAKAGAGSPPPPPPIPLSTSKVGTGQGVQGQTWHCPVAVVPGAGLYRVWVGGEYSHLFPLKKNLLGTTGGKKHKGQGHGVPCVLHPVPRSKGFEGQSGPIPAPGAGKLPGQPGKARHGGCSRGGWWAGWWPTLLQSWPSPFVCMGSTRSGPGCPGWLGTAGGEPEPLGTSHRQPAGRLVALGGGGGHCLARGTSPRPGVFLARDRLCSPSRDEHRGRSRGWWG